jgi:hypothetical protein
LAVAQFVRTVHDDVLLNPAQFSRVRDLARGGKALGPRGTAPLHAGSFARGGLRRAQDDARSRIVPNGTIAEALTL